MPSTNSHIISDTCVCVCVGFPGTKDSGAQCTMLSQVSVRLVNARVCEHVVRAQVLNVFACCSQKGAPGERNGAGANEDPHPDP